MSMRLPNSYDSQSNGLAESAVNDVKDAVRVNLTSLSSALDRHPLPWLVKHSAAAMVNRCWRGPDGMTAHKFAQRAKFTALPHFAEEILS